MSQKKPVEYEDRYAEAFMELEELTKREKLNESIGGTTFNVDHQGIEELQDILDKSDDYSDTIDIIDGDAYNDQDLKSSYAGNLVLRCSVCGQYTYAKPDDIVKDEEKGLVNVDVACPFCYSREGYKIVGEIRDDDSVDLNDEKSSKEEEKIEYDDTLKGSMLKNFTKDLSDEDLKELDIVFNDEVEEPVEDNIKNESLKKSLDRNFNLISKIDTRKDHGRHSIKKSVDEEKPDFESTKYREAIDFLLEKGMAYDMTGLMKETLETLIRQDYEDCTSWEIEEFMDVDRLAERTLQELFDKLEDHDYTYIPDAVLSNFLELVGLQDQLDESYKMNEDCDIVLSENSYDLNNEDGSIRVSKGLTKAPLRVGDEIKVCFRDREPDNRYPCFYRIIDETPSSFILEFIGDEMNECNMKECNINECDITECNMNECDSKDLEECDLKVECVYKESYKVYTLRSSKDENLNKAVSKAKKYIQEGVKYERGQDRQYEAPYFVNIMIPMELTEDFNSASLETEDNKVDVTSDDKGIQINVTKKDEEEKGYEDTNDLGTDEPKEEEEKGYEDTNDLDTDEPKEEEEKENSGEVISEVSDETKEKIEKKEEEEEEEVEDIDETEFDDLGEQFLKDKYSNVKSYKTTKGFVAEDGIMLEGLITFESGATKKTIFALRPIGESIRGKYKFAGENPMFSSKKQAFTISGTIKDKKLMMESLNVNFSQRDPKTNVSKTIYGTYYLNK